MAKKDMDKCDVIKKGEASRRLGFGATAGYRYLTFLEKQGVISPVILPGIKAHRYLKEEILALAKNKDPNKHSHVGEFKTNN